MELFSIFYHDATNEMHMYLAAPDMQTALTFAQTMDNDIVIDSIWRIDEEFYIVLDGNEYA